MLKKFILLSILCISSAAISFALFKKLQQAYEHDLTETLHEALKIKDSIIKHITKTFDTIEQPLKELTNELTNKTTTEPAAIERLQKFTCNHTMIYGAGISSNMSSKEVPYVRCNKPIIDMAQFYDFTQNDRFDFNKTEKGRTWTAEPLNDIPDLHEPVMRFFVPFHTYNPNENTQIPNGFIFADIALSTFKSFFEDITDNPLIYATLLSENGTILFHPLTKGLTVNEYAAQTSKKYLRDFFNSLGNKRQGEFSFADNSEQGIISWEKLPQEGFVLLLVQKRGFFIDAVTKHILSMISCLIFGALACFLLSLLFLLPFLNSIDNYWFASGTFSVLAFLCTVVILYVYYQSNSNKQNLTATVINNNIDEKRFLNLNAKLRRADLSEEHLIPTGILIKSLTIEDEKNIAITGSLWQLYQEKDEKLSKGITITNAQTFKINPTHRIKTQKGTIYGYDFQAQLTESLDFVRYPMDRQVITIELAHSAINEPVILTPDFSSWKGESFANIGLDENLKNPDLVFEKTFFSYSIPKPLTNMGIEDYIFSKNFPLLNFNIKLKRNIVNPLILIFLPVFIILAISFGFLLIFRRLHDKPHATISINAAILFALIIAHQRLRAIIPSIIPSYPEYIYFFAYFIILFNTMIAVLFLRNVGPNYILTPDSDAIKIVRMLFWPTFFIALLCTTIFFFT